MEGERMNIRQTAHRNWGCLQRYMMAFGSECICASRPFHGLLLFFPSPPAITPAHSLIFPAIHRLSQTVWKWQVAPGDAPVLMSCSVIYCQSTVPINQAGPDTTAAQPSLSCAFKSRAKPFVLREDEECWHNISPASNPTIPSAKDVRFGNHDTSAVKKSSQPEHVSL